MLLSFSFAAVLALTLQSTPPDRNRAESLARSGQTVEAMAVFKKMVELDPRDVEARLWVARLALRLGQTEQAENAFRSVLSEHSEDVDALIGLGMTLTRRGAWREALETLSRAEQPPARTRISLPRSRARIVAAATMAAPSNIFVALTHWPPTIPM